MLSPELEDAFEELQDGLLASHRSTLFNLTDMGWKQIDAETDKYRTALSKIRTALEENGCTGRMRLQDCKPLDPERDVHTEHCCLVHGCKYGDEDCPVVTKNKTQSYPCEECGNE